MTCANAWPIDANGGDLSCYCPIVRLVKDWNEIVGSVMDWQIGDDLVDWSRIGAFLVFLNDGVLRPIVGLRIVLVPSAICTLSVCIGFRLVMIDW